MVAKDARFTTGVSGQRHKIESEQLTAFFEEIHSKHTLEEVVFLCIGTDRSTGDALGPLTGSRLLEYGFPHVIGTLKAPCDADTLESNISFIPSDKMIIAVDACLGQPSSVGSFLVSEQPLHPARSVGGVLPPVGHYSVAAVVNVNGPKPYWTLQMTSLYQVMQQAGQIAASAARAFRLIG